MNGKPLFHNLATYEVFTTLDADVKDGLTEEDSRRRLDLYGLNRLSEKDRVQWYHVLIRQFMSLFIAILAVAAGISYLLGEMIDALAIGAIIILNGLLSFVQEWKAETALQGLKSMLAPQCRVMREGKIRTVDAAVLVPGDYVFLETGDNVPADLRLVKTVNLKADEAALTGESAPVDKDEAPVESDMPIDGRSCMVWMGTTIVNGRAEGVVTATGMETEFGRIAGLTGAIEETQTRLQRQLAVLAKQLAVLALAVSALVVATGFLEGKDILLMFMTGVSLAVAAVPEGLPAVVTVTLALGVRIMARRKALLRHLQAAETLGATSVICTDKTGTMTQNEMTVQTIWTGSGVVTVSGVGYDPVGEFSAMNDDVRALLDTGRKCNHARLVRDEAGGWSVWGTPTEAALIVAAEKAGLSQDHDADIIEEFSFNSRRKRMSVLEAFSGEDHMLHVKGAPEMVLPRCVSLLQDGQEVGLDEAGRAAIETAYKNFAQQGLRTLALARRAVPQDMGREEELMEKDMVFLGIVGVIDPPRPEVAAALEKAQNAGIRVIMVTGDAPDTALAIGRQIGLKAARAVTGPALQAMSDEELMAVLEGDVLFARTVPEDKYRLVKILQSKEQLVAMTGDGVNDAPALKQADIGIAMGIRGTDVARGASDIVLSDDNFASIIGAIEEGRRQYANIRKFVRYLLSSNIGEIIAIFLNILFGGPLILLPVQILWMNLVTDGVAAITLGVEKSERDAMSAPPRPLNEPILGRDAMLLLAGLGGYIGLVTLGLYHYYLNVSNMGEMQAYLLANSVAFTGIVVMEKINVLNFRTLSGPLSSIGWLSNPWLVAAVTAMIVLQICAVYVPALQEILHTVPLGAQEWLIILAVTAPLFIIPEMIKTIKYKKNHRHA